MKEQKLRRVVREELKNLQERNVFNDVSRTLKKYLPSYDSIKNVGDKLIVKDGPDRAVVSYNYASSSYTVRGDGQVGGLAEEVLNVIEGAGFKAMMRESSQLDEAYKNLGEARVRFIPAVGLVVEAKGVTIEIESFWSDMKDALERAIENDTTTSTDAHSVKIKGNLDQIQ